MKKIFNLSDSNKFIAEIKSKKLKIALCHGVFDIIHYGHLKHFEAAKKHSDILIVTITADKFVKKGEGRPIFNENIRLEMLSNINLVDFVSVVEDESANPAILKLKPDFYVKGNEYKDNSSDHTNKILKEVKMVKKFGGEILYTSEPTYSSSNLVSSYFNFLNKNQKNYIRNIKKNYGFSDVIRIFDKLKEKNVLLVGESIIDKYIYCEVIGKAGKEPVLNVRRSESDEYLGGIISIGNLVSNFCKSVTIISVLGDDKKYEKHINSNINSNVKFFSIQKSKSPTIKKTRFIDSTKRTKLLGVYDINDRSLNKNESTKLYKLINEKIPNKDLTIVCDFGHGFLDNQNIRLLEKKSKFLCVNTQLNSSNIGFNTISKYKSPNYVCMHEGELRHDFRERDLDVKLLAMKLLKKINAKTAVITKGKEGSLITDKKNKLFDCPAMINESEIRDKIGAGDTLFGLTSLLVESDCPNDMVILLGNIAAAKNITGLANSVKINKEYILSTLKTYYKYV